jgi:DNA primase
MNSLEVITAACRELLLTFEPARGVQEYLDGRLLIEAQEAWQFGYFPPNQYLGVLLALVGEEVLKEHNLIYDKRTPEGVFRCSTMAQHNMVLPYHNQYGEVVGIVGRTILSEDDRKRQEIAKYKNTHFNKGKVLFGLDKAKQAIVAENKVIIVEGQYDCISAHGAGMRNVVAIGASNLTFDQFSLIYRYTDNIVMLLDDDEAGHSGTQKAIEDFGEYANVRSATLPAGLKDLDEYLKETHNNEVNLIIT